jgi:hypothetical protein
MIDDSVLQQIVGDFFSDKIKFQEIPKSPVGATLGEPPKKLYLETLKEQMACTVETALYKIHVFNKALHTGHTETAKIAKLDLDGHIKEIFALQGKLLAYRKTEQSEPGGKEQFEDEIRRAKKFPVEQLIQFNNRGFALCLWHTEKTPSMHLKDNRVYCFS